MERLLEDSYRNVDGESFDLEVVKPHQLQGADHWDYAVVAKHEQWGQRTFHVTIRKDFIGQEMHADMFVRGDPLTCVKRLLDNADSAGVPVTWQDPTDDWVVM